MKMNKTNLRILSKLGLLLVVIGFFMPISCNLNGFQIAQAESEVFGLNFISVSLYSVFIFSCIGLLLLFVLLLSQRKYSIAYDWINLIIIIFSFLIFIAIQTQNAEELSTFISLQLQYGAYVIFLGVLVSFVSLLFASMSKEENMKNIEDKVKVNINKNAIIISFFIILFISYCLFRNKEYVEGAAPWTPITLLLVGIPIGIIYIIYILYKNSQRMKDKKLNNKDFSIVNKNTNKNIDKKLFETSDNLYPDSFYEDKKKQFYPITGLNIKEAVTVKKILALAEKTSFLTLKDIVKNTDIKIEEAEKLLPVLVSAGFEKTEESADGISTYTFEINSAEKQILDIAKNQFPLNLEDIIKKTELEIEVIKTALTKLIKIGYFIKCGNKVIFEPDKQVHIDTVYYYVFADIKNIEEHLQWLIDEDKEEKVRYLINALPLSLNFENYLISLLKDNRAAFALDLASYSEYVNEKPYLYIRKLGYLHIKNGNKDVWDKEIKKIKKVSNLNMCLFILLCLGNVFCMLFLFLPYAFESEKFALNIIIFLIWIIITLFFTFYLFPSKLFLDYKSLLKSLNKLFEIPEQKKTKKSKA